MLLNVKHFRVTGKPIRQIMMPHNNIGLNSKVSEDMATEITKNRRFYPPQCHLKTLAMKPRPISTTTLYRLKVESLGYISAANSMGLSSSKFLW